MPLGKPTVLPFDPFADYGLDFNQEAANFAALVAFPFKKTEKSSGWFYVPDARNFLRAEDLAWSRETGATRLMSQYGYDQFLAQPYGGDEPVSKDDARDWMDGEADLAAMT
ncbi:MAG TPA: hypothetical protein VI893_10880, partial [Thermoplasmata archaeon]|nr:hypothetical protein [Thermoplasmata archaeon]